MSAYFPKDGPPRIIRFTTLRGLLARLDRDTNVLEVDAKRYDLLSNLERLRVCKTMCTQLVLDLDAPHGPSSKPALPTGACI